MFDYKIALTVLAIVAGFIGYVLYIRNILAGKTKPHAFSWFVWAFIAGIAFAAQVVGKGGHGAFVMGFTALACAAIQCWLCLRESVIFRSLTGFA